MNRFIVRLPLSIINRITSNSESGAITVVATYDESCVR